MRMRTSVRALTRACWYGGRGADVRNVIMQRERERERERERDVVYICIYWLRIGRLLVDVQRTA